MAQPIKMPKLGQTMEEGVIERWLVNEGDEINKGDILLEITTDKATLEVESFHKGTVLRLVRGAGETVAVTETIAWVGKPGEAVPEGEPAAAPAAASAPSAPSAPAKAEPAPAPTASPPPAAPAAPAPAPTGRVKASPLARKLAAERGVDLRSLTGSGPGGRIVKADVLGATPGAAPSTPAAPAFAEASARAGAEDKTIPLTGMRKAIARQMAASKATAPHFYVTMKADMTCAVEARQELGPLVEQRYGMKLSFTHLIVRAVAVALREFPGVNASFNGDSFVQHGHVNVGIAVSIEDGLIVPVLHDADAKNLGQVVVESNKLVDRARAQKLSEREFTGGTFTVSNLGMFGAQHFQAIINTPEAGILAVGAIVKEPVVVDDQIAVRPMMSLTLSVDHRVVDGALGARFLARVVELLENPMLALVNI